MTAAARPESGSTSRFSGELAFLIADVRGYTRFTRERGDSEAARLAARFATLARDAVEARGGHVIELRGDEALAVFESPAAAVRAACELVAACAEEHAGDPTLPLLVGVGGDVGEAVPVEEGFRGAALNTAARFCSHAEGGQVLVSARLAEQAGEISGVSFEARGEAELKGFETPVQLIEAVAEQVRRAPVALASSEPLPIELESETPPVGRERELSWLRGTWRQVRRGYGRVLFVSGPTGIGKTRLVAELAAFAHELVAKVVYAGAGGAGAALAAAAIREAAAEPAPTLLVLDDLDATFEAVVPVLHESFEAIEAGATMVVGLVRDTNTSPELAALVARADRTGDGHRELGPLDAAGVREIARVYSGEDVSEAPLESIARASAGVPGRVHELMSEWAEQEATRRLSAAAEWLAAGRRERSADLEFANNVIGLKLARIFGGEPGAEWRGSDESPYKGLSAFGEEDASLFFGRERLVGELAARTVSAGLLAVVGASGSGKSSVIAAGLLPSLRARLLPGSDRWRSAVMRPGQDPLAELETQRASLPDGDGRLVLVVDQFEEVFTTCRDENKRVDFVDSLVSIAGDPDRAVVVIGLRGDYYGHCGAYPVLATLVAANQVLVGPMSADELRRAIELPARRAGVRVESALAETLVDEVADEPGGLPLLSTALVELWLARRNGWLSLDAHERLGGVRGAVARLAEGSYDNLDEAQRDAVHRLFLRLVTSSGEGIVARRRVARAELDLDRDAVLASVVERLTEDRLLTAEGTTVEVAHEALLREWPRLQAWLAEDAQGRELREHLTESAQRWQESERDESELYRGARLSATLDWAARRAAELIELERAYLDESRRQSELEAERQRRTNRRLRTLLVGAAVLLVAAVVAGVVALVQRASAKKEARVALARELGAQAVSEPRIDRAMLLARASRRLDRSPKTEGTLLATLLRSPAALGTFTVPIHDRPLKITLSPDGRRLLVTNNNNELLVYDARTHLQVLPPLANHGGATRVLYTPDRKYILVGGGDPGAPPGFDMLDARTHRVVRHFSLAPDKQWMTTPTGLIEGVSVTPDGRTLFYGYTVLRDSQTGPAFLDRWDIATGKFLGLTPLKTKGLNGFDLADGGRTLVVVGDSEVTTWDVRTLRKLRSVPFHTASGGLGAVSPDGATVAIGTMDGSVFLLDLRTGRLTQTNGGHQAQIDALQFTPDGRTLVTAGDDGDVILWDAESGTRLETLRGHGGRITGLSISADGKTLYTCSLDGAIFKWDLGVTRRFGKPFRTMKAFDVARFGFDDGPPPLAVSHDGSRFAVRLGPSSVALHSTRTTRRQSAFAVQPGARLLGLAWSSAGRLGIAGEGGLVQLWDVRSRPRLVRKLEGLRSTNGKPEEARTVAFSPDGRLVAAGDVNQTAPEVPYRFGTVAVWNAESGKLLWKTRTKDGMVSGLAFSPDGKTLVVARERGSVLWQDARTGHVERKQNLEGGASAVAYAQDGTLATGSWPGIVQLWNSRTGGQIGHATLVAAAPVASISFTPDGDRFATAGGSDGLAKIWETKTQQQFGATFPGDPGAWGSVAYTPDGSKLIVIYADGKGFLWPTSLGQLEQHACAVAGRNFTREEWSRYVSNRAYSKVCP